MFSHPFDCLYLAVDPTVQKVENVHLLDEIGVDGRQVYLPFADVSTRQQSSCAYKLTGVYLGGYLGG